MGAESNAKWEQPFWAEGIFPYKIFHCKKIPQTYKASKQTFHSRLLCTDSPFGAGWQAASWHASVVASCDTLNWHHNAFYKQSSVPVCNETETKNTREISILSVLVS